MGKSKNKRRQQILENRRRKQNERLAKLQFRKVKQKFRYGDSGWHNEWKKFNEQLAKFGLYIKDMTGDGNCLFRALADQLEGSPNNHHIYREKICDYIAQHRDLFEPFIEDDVPFEEYLTQMRKNATWGGNIEIQAASLLFHVNISIYQLDQPRWDIINWEDGARTIHLSYHQGDHYASVRRLEELKNSKASSLLPFQKFVKTSFNTKRDNNNNNVITFGRDKNENLKKKPITKEELYIMETTGCQNLQFIRNVMRDNYDDVNATIEFINLIGANDSKFQEEFYSENVSQQNGSDSPENTFQNTIDNKLKTEISHNRPSELHSSNQPDNQHVPSDTKKGTITTLQDTRSENTITNVDFFLNVEESACDDVTSLQFHPWTNNNVNSDTHHTDLCNNETGKKSVQLTKQSLSSNESFLPTTTPSGHKIESSMASDINQTENEKDKETPPTDTTVALTLEEITSEEQRIMEITNCCDIEFIRTHLRESGNDVETTVQTLLLLDSSVWTTNTGKSSQNKILKTNTTSIVPISNSSSTMSSNVTNMSKIKEKNTREVKVQQSEEKQKQKMLKKNKRDHEQQQRVPFSSNENKPIHPKLLKFVQTMHQSNKERKRENQIMKQQRHLPPPSQPSFNLNNHQQRQQTETVNPEEALASVERVKI